jgi:hypothetical protein
MGLAVAGITLAGVQVCRGQQQQGIATLAPLCPQVLSCAADATAVTRCCVATRGNGIVDHTSKVPGAASEPIL